MRKEEVRYEGRKKAPHKPCELSRTATFCVCHYVIATCQLHTAQKYPSGNYVHEFKKYLTVLIGNPHRIATEAK